MNFPARMPKRHDVQSANVLRNYGKNITLLSALHLGGMQAPLVIEGSTTSAGFEVYLEQVLVPVLEPGDVVILDNLAAYSPDLSPLEQAFFKLKQVLWRAKAQLDALIVAIAQALDAVSWGDTVGWFTNCGFLNLA